MLGSRARSTPNLVDPPPARVPVRQRGADSRIRCVAAFGRRGASPLGDVSPWPDQRTDPMPSNKDFKRLVRARMRKTGEAYTTARAQILTKKQVPASLAAGGADYASLAGMSDATIKARERLGALERVLAPHAP